MSISKEQAKALQERVEAARTPMSIDEVTRRLKAGIPVPPSLLLRGIQEHVDANGNPYRDDKEIARAKASLTPRDRGMNKSEAAYAKQLEALGHTWRYEPLKLRLADLTYYSPDFMVIDKDGTIQFHEVKAQWKGAKTFHSEDDAKVKIKVAAEQFPWFSFRIVWKSPEGWQYKTY